jgi:hypothetical protein
MGCKTQGGYKFGVCAGFGPNLQHCYYYTAPAGSGVTLTYEEYPENAIRSGNYNIPGREANAVMYPSIAFEANATPTAAGNADGPGAANCGKITKADTCTTSNLSFASGTPTIALDYFPDQLSFDYNFSDTWFAYLYDTSNNGGIIGTPCFYIETETQTRSSGAGASATSESTSSTICHPCTAYSATPARTTLRYTGSADLTGDLDCPHPTLFGIGTDSKKLCFTYNSLSTQLPNGVVDFEVSYDGVTYEDKWDQGANAGTEYVSSQNPWQADDISASSFEVYDLSNGTTQSDFIVKFRIEPIFDDTGSTVVFTGTRWIATELLNAGTGYNVGDVFQLEHIHRHPDNSLSTFTLNLKVTAIGPVSAETSGDANFDVLRVGDTINGHSITRAFHMFDVYEGLNASNNFSYHVIYLDGAGSDFVKETQYTSDRNHVITAKAGYGIVDRAILVGLYEFLDKSLQYLTGDVNKNAPDTFNEIRQPVGFVEISESGRVTGVNLDNGVFSFDNTTLTEGSGYTTGNDISCSGGSGSGLKVDIEAKTIVDNNGNTLNNVITSIRVSEAGSGYATGDVVTISGGSATIKVAEITHGGENWQYLPTDPILKMGDPSDSGAGLQRTSAEDGAIDFTYRTNKKGDLKFEIITSDVGDPTIELVSAAGGTNRGAEIKGKFVGGVLTNVKIKDGGKGYTRSSRPTIFVSNDKEENTLIQKNDGFRGDLVDEFSGILGDLPDGGAPNDPNVPRIQESDYRSLSDSYGAVPSESDIVEIKPKIEMKLDPDRTRIDQLPQNRFSKDATEPLKEFMKPKYDLNYLDEVEVPQDYKDTLVNDKIRISDQVDTDIDLITQPKIPEFKETQETKVESVQGSFTGLPTSSKYTKYIMRQYRPDPGRQASIIVSLTMSPVNTGCAHIVCAPPLGSIGGTTTAPGDPDPVTGDPTTTTTTNSFSMFPLTAPPAGPGTKEWTATGQLNIFHDLTRSASTVVLAVDAQGNPFAV